MSMLKGTDVESQLRRLPGNNRCVDCMSLTPKWGSVNNGVLICYECAGKHRSLGVEISFVKSMDMDSWTQRDIDMVLSGGNAKWEAVCVAASLQACDVKEKYSSSIADKYRNRISKAAESESKEFSARDFLAELQQCVRCSSESDMCSCYRSTRLTFSSDTTSCGSSPEDYGVLNSVEPSQAESNAVSRPLTTARFGDTGGQEELSVRCTLCSVLVPLEVLDAHSSKCQTKAEKSANIEILEYDVTLGKNGGPLGLTFTRLPDGRASVSRIEPGGDAEQENVLVGSTVVALGNLKITQFDELMDRSKSIDRPAKFRFQYRQDARNTLVNIPEPVASEKTVEFKTMAIGLEVEEKHGMCAVQSIHVGSEAEKAGVLVGWTISDLNRSPEVSLSTVREALASDKRPLLLTFHRVEGTMRGWIEE